MPDDEHIVQPDPRMMLGTKAREHMPREEQATREQFGEYVSIYNFRDAIEDGATVPLYYENRIPE